MDENKLIKDLKISFMGVENDMKYTNNRIDEAKIVISALENAQKSLVDDVNDLKKVSKRTGICIICIGILGYSCYLMKKEIRDLQEKMHENMQNCEKNEEI